jgi:DNA-binding NtrC family response regulator
VPARALRRLLIVEDSSALVETLERALSARVPEVRACRSLSEVRQVLAEFTPDLVLLDVELPDGDAFDVLGEMRRIVPAPAVVAMSGVAGPDEAFHLAQVGVQRYLKKPLDLTAVERAIDEALTCAPDLEPHVRAAVGHVSFQEVERSVREAMLDEALARSGGSRSAAARMLAISRQLLQYMLRKRGGTDSRNPV